MKNFDTVQHVDGRTGFIFAVRGEVVAVRFDDRQKDDPPYLWIQIEDLREGTNE